MCNFLSLVETDRHEFYLFTPEQRIAHAKKPLTDKNGNAYKLDSHASICAFYGLDEDAVNKYEWNPYKSTLDIDQMAFDVDKKRVQEYLNGIDWRPVCGDVEGLWNFCDRMKKIRFFKRSIKRSKSFQDGVKLFKDRAAAEDAAWGPAWADAWGPAWADARAAAWAAAWAVTSAASRDVAWDTVWATAKNAARDATLYAQINFLCAGLSLDAKHVDHIKKRWSVWEAGYGVACDVDGVLYCYKKP